jgi:hypothetical protein
MTMRSVTRLLVLVAAMRGAGPARADVDVGDDAWNGPGRLSRLEYGIDERLGRAWLVQHFTYSGPCRGSEDACELDAPVRLRMPGLTYDPARRQVLYSDGEGAPAICATVVKHRFLWSWETVEATGRCGYRTVNVDAFDDDGFGGREVHREEVRFGARP